MQLQQVNWSNDGISELLINYDLIDNRFGTVRNNVGSPYLIHSLRTYKIHDLSRVIHEILVDARVSCNRVM